MQRGLLECSFLSDSASPLDYTTLHDCFATATSSLAKHTTPSAETRSFHHRGTGGGGSSACAATCASRASASHEMMRMRTSTLYRRCADEGCDERMLPTPGGGVCKRLGHEAVRERDGVVRRELRHLRKGPTVSCTCP